jgi:membrane protease subunit HflK
MTGQSSGRSVPRESLMLTQDENIIDIKFAIQYRIKDVRDYKFNVNNPDETLHQATESAVREIIGKSKMDFVLTEGRSEVVNRAKDLIQDVIDRYGSGLQVTSVNMQDAQPPEQVQAAFSDAVKAREDEVRLKNEAEAYANDVLPKARGRAARMMEEANAYKEQVIAQAEGEASRFTQVLAQYKKAPQVTRQRLYLDAIEEVMTNSTKVLVDVGDGNNLLYLPLDKMMQQAAAVPLAQDAASAAKSNLTTPSTSIIDQNNLRERSTSRTRESR